MSHRDHVFGQDVVRAGEKRTLIVVVITAVMMAGEIISGLVVGFFPTTSDWSM